MGSGKDNFVTPKGVDYLLKKYLSPSDYDDLKKLNNEYTQDRFKKELLKRLEKGSGGGSWIPTNYEDELVANAGANIGTSRRSERLKNGRNVDVYETSSGKNVYEDNRGRLRDYGSGRFIGKNVFEE